MRTNLFFKNSIVILGSKLLCYLVEFICRTVLIYTLPMEYVGVTGLFSNILSVLSLTELGFGTVLVYSMYVPLAQKDEARLLALTGFYQKTYRIITLLIGSAGLLLLPFLPYLIKDNSSIPRLELIYLLYLANTVLSYTFTYKQSLFIADQKLYITTLYTNLLRILKNIAQIALLIATHSFLLYLLIQLPFTLFTNVLLSKKAEKAYPFLTGPKPAPLPAEEKKQIFKNVYAMFNHRVGATVLNSTDNLLISSFLGLAVVSKNDSYNMIINLLRYLMTPIFSALNASIGSYHASRSKEDTYRLFGALHLAGVWFYTFCSSSLFLLINPFIELIWGAEFLFPMPVVLLLSVNFYIVGIRQIPLTFKESMGLLSQDRYKPLIEVLINLIASVLLVKLCGAAGIFLGTLISIVSTSLWVEPFVLFHYGFGQSAKAYWRKTLSYLFTGAMAFSLTALCCLPLRLAPLPLLLLRLIPCCLVPNLLFLLCYCHSEEFRLLFSVLRSALPQKKERNE